MNFCCMLLALAGTALAAPQFGFQAPPAGNVQFGVDAAGCLVGPSGKVCPTGPVQFTSAAAGVAAPSPPPRPAQHAFPVHPTFTGLVGPSGVIGPSGLVGPSGPLAFGR